VLDLDVEIYARETDPMLSHINIGTGNDISILELAQMVADITGFKGKIKTDPSQPDGTPRKLLDVSRLKRLGWQASIDLEEGIQQTYTWFCKQEGQFRA
jgi:nucleoside-diphosphate-sugar epimerase